MKLNRETTNFNFYQYPVPQIIDENYKENISKKLNLGKINPSNNRYTLFISIPYCRSRCSSCMFFKNRINSINESERILDKYLKGVYRQIKYFSNTKRFSNSKCVSIYIGGGTASLLSSNQIVELLNKLQNSFKIEVNAEITLEINPRDADSQYYTRIHDSIINRVSLGIQSLNNGILNILGSPNKKEHNLKVLELSQRHMLKTVNVDLIYGIPSQTKSVWLEDLSNVIQYKPQGITIYKYKVFDNSKMKKNINRGQLPKQPNGEEIYNFYLIAYKLLSDNGYIEDSFGSFSLRGHSQQYREQSYKLGYEILGIGAGSYSFINDYLFTNNGNVDEFLEFGAKDVSQVISAISSKATKRNLMIKYTMHNLYYGYIDREIFIEIFNVDITKVFKDILKLFEINQLITVNKISIKVTDIGKMHFDNLLYEFYKRTKKNECG